MSFALSGAVTGGAQTGFTAPTYTVSADVAPDVNGKQYAVTALGGTQAGVTAHSVASPFTITYWRPKIFKVLGIVSNGVVAQVPMNVHKIITRKGVTPLAGQSIKPMVITTIMEVPAGSDTADAANVRAALSAHIGALSNQSAGVGDTVVSGVL